MSRDKKIEEMAKAMCLDCAKDSPCSLAQVGGMCNSARKQATALYNAGYRKQSEWISVEERLPEAECPVLIFTRKNRYYVGYYYEALIDPTFTGFYADDVRRDVTHWMPLPEAPKKGGGEG